MTFKPSPEQLAYFNFLENSEGNAIIEAVAGAGKSTTLVQGLPLQRGSTALMAFNKKAAEDLQEKAGPSSTAEIGTCHSFGFRLFKQNRKFPKVDQRAKSEKLYEKTGTPRNMQYFYSQALSLAKQRGFGLAGFPAIKDAEAWLELAETHSLEDELPSSEEAESITLEEALLECPRLLSHSNFISEVIDFDDMIYLPLLHDFPVSQQFKWVLVDEAQDTNPARRALASRLLHREGRFVAVGDPFQAIYGFTGADNDSLQQIAARFSTTSLPLHTSFRCARSVVQEAQRYVPHIRSFDGAPLGSVQDIYERDRNDWLLDVRPGDVILCRNTKPLLSLCFRLIRAGRGAKVEGRKIGEGLKALVRKFRWSSFDQLRGLLRDYRVKEVAQLKAKNKNLAAEYVNDKVECILAITENCSAQNSTGLCNYIDTLFEDTNSTGKSNIIHLSTIHKAKGREWSTVFWYGPNKYQPSPFARQEWELDQERNLMYVAATRAKLHLRKILLET